MKIDVTKKIVDLDGKAMKVVTGAEGEPPNVKPITSDATLRAVAVQALWNPLQGDEKLSAADKIKHDMMARLIHSNDEVELKVEDANLLKERINRAFSHVGIVAGAHALIEAAADPAQKDAVAA